MPENDEFDAANPNYRPYGDIRLDSRQRTGPYSIHAQPNFRTDDSHPVLTV